MKGLRSRWSIAKTTLWRDGIVLYAPIFDKNRCLPGIKGSENLLFPATNVGEAGFETIVEDQNLFTGNVYYDNFGSYFTGRNRWGATVEISSPTGNAEKVTVGSNISDYGTFFGYPGP